MYKELNRQERRLIRENTNTEAEKPKWTTLVKNVLIFILVFLLFAFVGYFMVTYGQYVGSK